MVIDKSPSRLLASPVWLNWGIGVVKHMLTLCGETNYICIYMMVVYLCGKTDTKLCVVKQSIYVYIYMYV